MLLYLCCFFSSIKVALKVVIMATMTTVMVPLLTAWGREWGAVGVVASAMALDTDHHLLSTVLMLTRLFLWYMALSRLRSTLTKSSTFSASTAT